MIDTASGPVSKGTCQICGAEKEFQNSLNEQPPFTIAKEGNMPYRRYDGLKEEIIAAFINSGRNVAATAKQMGIPEGGTLYGLLRRWGVMEKPQKPKKEGKKMPLPKDYPGGIVKRAVELKAVRQRAYDLMRHETISSDNELRKALEKEFGIKLSKSTVNTWYNRGKKEPEVPKIPPTLPPPSSPVFRFDHLKFRVQLTVGYRSLTLEEADVSLTSKILVEFLIGCNPELAVALRDTLGRDMRLNA